MLLSYWGVSPLSRGIQFANWRNESHVAEVFPDGVRIAEMWKKGARIIENPWEGHSRRTRVFLHRIRNQDRERIPLIEEFYEDCVRRGIRYDFVGITRFLTRRDPRRFRRETCRTVDLERVRRFVCSSMIAFAHCRFERPLIDQHWWRVYPGLLVDSTRVTAGVEIFRGEPWPREPAAGEAAAGAGMGAEG